MTTNKYTNTGSLIYVRKVLTQAGEAINNPFQGSNVSIIPKLVEAVAVPGGAVAGGAVGVGALAASGMLTVLPDFIGIWHIQRQLVADVAAC